MRDCLSVFPIVRSSTAAGALSASTRAPIFETPAAPEVDWHSSTWARSCSSVVFSASGESGAARLVSLSWMSTRRSTSLVTLTSLNERMFPSESVTVRAAPPFTGRSLRGIKMTLVSVNFGGANSWPGCASITAWLSLASGVANTSVVGQSAPTWTSGTVDRFSSVMEMVRWTGFRCEGDESAGNGSASACATMRATRLLAMVHRCCSRGRGELESKVPIHDLEPIRSRSSARNDALDEIDDEALGDSGATLIEQTAFDSFHG